MLQFFRKYQKILFIVVTVAIIISFTFFGAYSTFARAPITPDRQIGVGLSGKPLRQQQLLALYRMLSTSLYAPSKEGAPNLFNDGVLEKEFLSNGLGLLLASNYFDVLKPELDERSMRIKQFRPYTHPEAKEISAEKVWQTYSPSLFHTYQRLKMRSDQGTLESFALSSQLFLEQTRLPSETLRQLLYMQQRQMKAPEDPRLGSANLSLFGFRSLEEWFGPRFLTLATQCILNGAQLAESKGYEVKREEVRAELFQNLTQGIRSLYQAEQMSAQELEQYYHAAMRHMGFDEELLLTTWRHVMLYRRMVDDVSSSVLLDPLAFNQFASYSKEAVDVDLYQLPKALQFPDFLSMLRFEIYLDAISKSPAGLEMPSALATVEEVEKKLPELVERACVLEWAAVSKSALAQAFSLKETGNWEVENAHWELLSKHFPLLASSKAHSREERFALLNSLESKERLTIDTFARKEMLATTPEKILFALEKAELSKQACKLRIKGSQFPFSAGKKQRELLSLLEKTPLDQAITFTPDEETYYRIFIRERSSEKRIASFAEAEKEGLLASLLDAKLEEFHLEARKKEPKLFQNSDGQFRAFKEVKEQIGKCLYAPLLKAIEKEYGESLEQMPLHFYSNARMLGMIKKAKRAFLEGAPLKQEEGLRAQWQLEKKEMRVERCGAFPFAKEPLFKMQPQEWSDVWIGEKGAVGFCLVKGVNALPPAAADPLEKGHQILSLDAKRALFANLLKEMREKKAIDPAYSPFAEPVHGS